MRIFYSFVALLCTGLLFFVPISEGIEGFRTDTKVDELPSVTAVAETTDNLTLSHSIYNDDPTGLTLLSTDADDTPALNSYQASTHSIIVSGLADNTTRTITVTYTISAMTLWSGVDTLMDYTPLVWYLSVVSFIVISLLAIWRGGRIL